MKLTVSGIEEKELWEKSGIVLPAYDVKAVREKTLEAPVWAHFGIGNIFRIFIGGIAEKLLNEGAADRGIVCCETFDTDIVDKIYKPFDSLGINVILNGDGRRDISVMGALCDPIKALPGFPEDWTELKRVFTSPSLQMISCTITEKGYALRNSDGEVFGFVQKDFENGPEQPGCAMGIITAMLLERFKAGATPLALVSMDNCSQNGKNFRNSVVEMATEWVNRGFAGKDFLEYVSDESRVAFPWTMIDKITPRPSEEIAADLEKAGVENMQPVITSKRTYIAPFQNAEGPQYLVIEDNFPNGRPALEKAGVYMTDRDTVNKSERMKVTVCLNPIHSALGTYGCLLGYTLFSEQMKDPDSIRLGNLVGAEGMKVVPDPVILSPKEFLRECMEERFPNPYLGDTVQRLVTDISQGVSIRFGETTKAYMKEFGTAAELRGIPYAIAGWLRYILAIDDEGNAFELSPDPMNDEMQEKLKDIVVGNPDTLKDQLKPILSNKNIFGVDYYEAGIGEKIEDLFRRMIAGKGAVRKVLSEV
ncbi:MAG: mannitol dehydrogenase family protein [Lachnospiraceae bacterium]|nr:mannitol dehydrogenase family protein [Candidatus Minthocola equi]